MGLLRRWQQRWVPLPRSLIAVYCLADLFAFPSLGSPPAAPLGPRPCRLTGDEDDVREEEHEPTWLQPSRGAPEDLGSLPSLQLPPVVDSGGRVPSLKSLAERGVAESLVDPRTALQLFEYAEALESPLLKGYCAEVAAFNLDLILCEGGAADLAALPDHLLEELERQLPWYRPPPPPPRASRSEAAARLASREGSTASAVGPAAGADRVFRTGAEESSEQAVSRQVRALRRKLQQVELLEDKEPRHLDPHQRAKVLMKPFFLRALEALEARGDLAGALVLLGEGREAAEAAAGVQEPVIRPGTPLGTSPKAAAAASSSGRKGGNPDRGSLPPQPPPPQQQQQQSRAAAESHPLGEPPQVVGFAAPSDESQQQQIGSKGKSNWSAGRKGGLSMFLRGDLDSSQPGPSSSSKPGAFSWGSRQPSGVEEPAGPSVASGSPAPGALSLLEIQQQEEERALR